MTTLGLVTENECPSCAQEMGAGKIPKFCPVCGREVPPAAKLSSNKPSKTSKLTWLVGLIVLVVIGRFVGGQVGRMQAERERRSNIARDSQSLEKSPSPTTPATPTKDSITSTPNPNFVKLHLPYGVNIEVPKSWRNITEGPGKEINLTVGTKVNLYRANSMPRSTYAGIAINATGSSIDPAELLAAPESELKAMESEMESSLRKELASVAELLNLWGLRRTQIGRYPAVVFEYKRSGPSGPVIVKMTRLFVGAREISLNLSYRESEGETWKPVLRQIESSFAVD